MISNFKSKIKALINYFRQLFIWLLKGKYFWISILILIGFIIFICICKIETCKNQLLIIGLLLQFIGLITIIYGINKKIATFTSFNPIIFHLRYFCRFPKYRKNYIMKAGPGNFGVTGADIDLQYKLAENASIERKIEYLLNQIERHSNIIKKIEKKHKEDITQITKQLKDYKTDTEEKIEELKETMEDINIGSVDLEFFGIFCLFMGILLTTIPNLF